MKKATAEKLKTKQTSSSGGKNAPGLEGGVTVAEIHSGATSQ